MDRVQTGADVILANAARDAALAYTNAKADIATGRASVADGQYFAVIGTVGSGIAATLYRRDSSTTQTLVNRLPASDAIVTDGSFGAFTIQALHPDTGYLGVITAPAFTGSGKEKILMIKRDGTIQLAASADSIVPADALGPDAVRLLPAGASSRFVHRDSGYLIPFEAGGVLLGGFTAEGKFRAVLDEQSVFPAGIGGGSAITMPTKSLSMWGDSITANMTGSAIAALIGQTFNNMGRGGQRSGEIAARQGSKPLLVTPTGNTIPASGSVVLTAISDDVLFNAGTWPSNIAVVLQGVEGSLTAVSGGVGGNPVGSGVYTFTRTSPGSAVACPPNSVMTVSNAALYRGDTIYLWVGHNNAGQAAVITDLERMVRYLTPTIQRVRILTLINDGGSAQATNKAIKARFPAHMVFDIRQYLMDFGLSDCGMTADSADLAAIAAGNIPPQLRGGDSIHPSSTCNTLCIEPAIARDYLNQGWNR
ncbi:hypothetical protein [Kaistia soli]|uniref:hypothetical protein n=1 Tax=Kaistia soli TaxID=446684 RepID=UPI0009346A03|nr:hypothetical protein [Kaistia soli]